MPDPFLSWLFTNQRSAAAKISPCGSSLSSPLSGEEQLSLGIAADCTLIEHGPEHARQVRLKYPISISLTKGAFVVCEWPNAEFEEAFH